MRRLGLDVGEKTVGVAMSDELGITASPLTTLKRDGREFDQLCELVAGHGVEQVIVGLPLTLRGEVGAAAQRSLAFAAELKVKLSIPVDTWDERHTTVQAEQALRSAGKKRAARRRMIDQVAAALILQSYQSRR